MADYLHDVNTPVALAQVVEATGLSAEAVEGYVGDLIRVEAVEQHPDGRVEWFGNC